MLTIHSPENGKEIKFTINGDEFSKDLRQVTSMFKGAQIIVAVTDGEIAIAATDDARTLILASTGEAISGKGSFIIDPQMFSSLIGKREALAFVFKDSVLNFKAKKGRYSGSISTEPINSDVVASINSVVSSSAKSVPLPQAVFDAIDRGMRLVNINDAYGESESEMVRYILADKESLRIATYDSYHSAVYDSKMSTSLKRPLKLAVYQSYFSAINSIGKGKKLRIAISDKQFHVSSDSFFLSLPPIQFDDTEVDYFLNQVDELTKKKKDVRCLINSENFGSVLDNICSIYELGSRIELDVTEKGRMQFSLVTNYGTMRDAMPVDKVKGSAKIYLDAPPITDTFACVPQIPECNFSYIKGTAYMLNFKDEAMTATYIISVLQ